MTKDPEIIAMSQVLDVFKYLDNGQRRRIIDWVSSRFSIEAETALLQSVKDSAGQSPPNPDPASPPVAKEMLPQPSSPADTTVSPETEPMAEASEDTPDVETEPGPKSGQEADDDIDPVKNLGLKRYRSIETLFLSSSVNTVSSKILLCAAYLQEKLNYKELSSYDINSRLKKLGYGVGNISNSLNTLIKKDPPLIVQTRKIGDSKQAKRRFTVTEEGLTVARTYLRGKPKQ